jgi:hypothetical protein
MGVDRDAHALEHLQHPDMRVAAGTAAGEHQPDARPLGFGGRRIGVGRGLGMRAWRQPDQHRQPGGGQTKKHAAERESRRKGHARSGGSLVLGTTVVNGAAQ